MGKYGDHRKIHLVAWEKVTAPKREGGLELRSMRQANVAFLAKLGWRLLAEPRKLWARVIRSKYCEGRRDIDMFKRKPDS